MAPPSPDACLNKHLHETRIFISDSHLRSPPSFFFLCRAIEKKPPPRTLDVESTVVGCIRGPPHLTFAPPLLHWKDFPSSVAVGFLCIFFCFFLHVPQKD
ncbi:hypothetical protein CI102_1449 [Trichoderma harzianum]|nr:hypothetical protein CI102_1449 [Trichoderma harzianum]